MMMDVDTEDEMCNCRQANGLDSHAKYATEVLTR